MSLPKELLIGQTLTCSKCSKSSIMAHNLLPGLGTLWGSAADWNGHHLTVLQIRLGLFGYSRMYKLNCADCGIELCSLIRDDNNRWGNYKGPALSQAHNRSILPIHMNNTHASYGPKQYGI